MSPTISPTRRRVWILPFAVLAMLLMFVLVEGRSSSGVDAQRRPTPTITMLVPIQLSTPTPTEFPLGVPPSPTPTPTPTTPPREETPDPLDDLAPNSTSTPIPEPPDDLTSDPTPTTAPEEPQDEQQAPQDAALAKVTVTKHACTSDLVFDPATITYDQLVQDPACQEDGGQVDLRLYDAAYDPPNFDQTKQTPGGVDDNQVEFVGVPSFEMTLTETLPTGYDNAVIFCGFGQPTTNLPITVADGDASATFLPDGEAGDTICALFNISGPQGNDIIIRNFICPSGGTYDINTDYITFQQDCMPNPSDASEFIVTDVNGATTNPTPVDGIYEVQGLPAGEFSIQQTLQPGYGTPIISCELSDNNSGNNMINRFDPADGLVESEFPADSTYTMLCDWFNTTEVLPGQEVGEIIIDKRLCPANYDLDAPTADYAVDCPTPANDIGFEIDGALAAFPDVWRQTGEDGEGLLIFGDLPLDTYTISEAVPNHVVAAAIFCTTTYLDGSSSTLQAVLDIDDVSSLASNNFNLISPVTITCTWANVPVADDLSSVVVNALLCAPAYDRTAPGADPAADCLQHLNGIGVSLLANDAGDSGSDGATGDDGIGRMSMHNLTPGNYDLEVSANQAGISGVFGLCGFFGPNGEELYFDDFMDIPPNGALTFTIDEGFDVECWVYYVSEGSGDNSVVIEKSFCPAGSLGGVVAISDLTQNYFEERCDPTTDDYTFVVTDSNALEVVPLNEGGTYRVQNMPDGDFSIEEELGAEFYPPTAFCWLFRDGVLVDTLDSIGEGDVPLESSFPSDGATYEFRCSFFNIEASSYLALNNYLCPAGYDRLAPGADPEVDCAEKLDGVTFTLDAADPVVEDRERITGEPHPDEFVSSSGLASFSGLPAGDYTLIETPPDNISSAFVICREFEGPLAFMNFDVYIDLDNTWSLPLTITPPLNIVCDWYNVEEDSNGIEVDKWVCPEGTPYDQTLDWYMENCVRANGDFEFELTTNTGSMPLVSEGGEEYYSGPLEDTPFSIQETIPPTYGAPEVFCRYWVPGPVILPEYDPYDAPTGYVEGAFTDSPEYYFDCVWFNIPGDPGSVTIYKWMCPEGYDVDAPGADPLVDCTNVGDGITFDAAGPDGYTDQQVTGQNDPGAVRFGDLEPGDYTFTEQVPEGIVSVFVLDCVGLSDGAVHPIPLSVGPELTIAVTASDVIVCNWYNVPEGDENELTFIKYWCATETFVSAAECEIYEGGITFDLLSWNGSDWVIAGTETTDSNGEIAWGDVTGGEYWFTEHDQSWCAVQTTAFTPEKDAFVVTDGEETVVKIYNCQLDPPTKQPPTKYPNTGVGPQGGGSDGPSSLPSFMALSSLLVLGFASVVRQRQAGRLQTLSTLPSASRFPERIQRPRTRT